MGRNVPVKISPKIVVSVAGLYTDVHRIFMEYIDNSIDSAEDFFDGNSNSYKKNIEINFDLVGDQIIASDNCSGISNFDKVIQSIGDSDKKKQTWTNGQFGYGIYAFMATCEKLQITSKEESASEANSVTLLRKDFAEKDIDNISYDIKNVKFDRSSGTVIKLSGFDKKQFKSFDITKIKDEIEKHFELLLKRKGLSIKLNDKNKSLSYECNSFDYLQYEGDNYVQSIDNLEIKDGRRSGITKINLTTPINIFLRVTRGKVIGKPPVFIAKSRRINEVNQMNDFKSKHKSDIWAHPNLTGYIDLSRNLEPQVHRTAFVTSEKKRAIFEYLISLEPYIHECINEVNKASEEKGYKELEDVVTKALSSLARVDAINFRTQNLPGGPKVPLKEGDLEHKNPGGGSGGFHGDGPPKPEPGPPQPGPGPHPGPHPTPGDDDISTSPGSDDIPSDIEDPFGDGKFTGDKKKQPGFDIKLTSGEPQEDINGKKLRSLLSGSQIRIFREHPDFEGRVKQTRKGESEITSRLITYIAGEITVHHKDVLQKRLGQPEYNIDMFKDLVDFIYQFEDKLRNQVGKSLNEW